MSRYSKFYILFHSLYSLSYKLCRVVSINIDTTLIKMK
nr:MAG TPA: hypothetical protein [Caudoviricetes sp.]